jgi:hypothetical protein
VGLVRLHLAQRGVPRVVDGRNRSRRPYPE